MSSSRENLSSTMEASHVPYTKQVGGTSDIEQPMQNAGPYVVVPVSNVSYNQGSYPGGPTTAQPAVAIPDRKLGSYPCTTLCIHCHTMVTTSVTYNIGTFQWVTAGIICLTGCWLGCCLVPFFIKVLADATHQCPSCKERIGVFKRLR